MWALQIWCQSIGQFEDRTHPGSGCWGVGLLKPRQSGPTTTPIVCKQKLVIVCRSRHEIGLGDLSLDLRSSFSDRQGRHVHKTLDYPFRRATINTKHPTPSDLPPPFQVLVISLCNPDPTFIMTSRQARLLALPSGLTRALASKPRISRLPSRHSPLLTGSMATMSTFKIPKVANEPNVRPIF